MPLARAYVQGFLLLLAVEQSRNGETHMTKRKGLSTIVALSILALLLGLMAGCGGSSTTSTTNTPQPPPPSPPIPQGTEFLYVGDNAGVIHEFGVDPNSGKLTPLATVAVTSPAAAGNVRLAADLGGKILYATSAVTGGAN